MSGHSQWQMIIWRIDVVAFFFPTYIINYTVWQISPFKPLTYSSFYILWSPTLLKTWYLQAQASFHSFYWTWVRSLATLVSLVDFIDLTLACEDANLKVIEVVTVADVDAEDCVGNSLLQIWELRFGLKAKLLFRLWAQGLVKILQLKFRQDYEAGFCSAFCRWCFVETMKLNLGRDSEAGFGQDFEF